jgi:hypothetical protein
MTERDLIVARKRAFPEGTRVRAVWFVLDTGRRIWPNQDQQGIVRVVDVHDERNFTVRWEGPQQEAAQKYPEALWSINDNESVPPGTEGTVRYVNDSGQLVVSWDNGRSIMATLRDEVEPLTAGA